MLICFESSLGKNISLLFKTTSRYLKLLEETVVAPEQGGTCKMLDKIRFFQVTKMSKLLLFDCETKGTYNINNSSMDKEIIKITNELFKRGDFFFSTYCFAEVACFLSIYQTLKRDRDSTNHRGVQIIYLPLIYHNYQLPLSILVLRTSKEKSTKGCTDTDMLLSVSPPPSSSMLHCYYMLH